MVRFVVILTSTSCRAHCGSWLRLGWSCDLGLGSRYLAPFSPSHHLTLTSIARHPSSSHLRSHISASAVEPPRKPPLHIIPRLRTIWRALSNLPSSRLRALPPAKHSQAYEDFTNRPRPALRSSRRRTMSASRPASRLLLPRPRASLVSS